MFKQPFPAEGHQWAFNLIEVIIHEKNEKGTGKIKSFIMLKEMTNYRILEWFALEGILKINAQWPGTPSTRIGCSISHPTWPWIILPGFTSFTCYLKTWKLINTCQILLEKKWQWNSRSFQCSLIYFFPKCLRRNEIGQQRLTKPELSPYSIQTTRIVSSCNKLELIPWFSIFFYSLLWRGKSLYLHIPRFCSPGKLGRLTACVQI